MVVIKEIKMKSKGASLSHQSIKKKLASKIVNLWINKISLNKKRIPMRKRKYVNNKPTNEYVTESEDDEYDFTKPKERHTIKTLYDIDCHQEQRYESSNVFKIIIPKEKQMKSYLKNYL